MSNQESDVDLIDQDEGYAIQLCSSSLQLLGLATWQWMGETDCFGVEDPDNGRLGFVSVVGNLGEFLVVSVYLGSEGLFGFIDFESTPTSPIESFP